MANYEFKKVLNFLGFLATMLIAVALLISIIFGKGTLPGFIINNFTTALVFIANVIAYAITIIAGFYYARSKRNIWFTIAQAVAAVLIVVLLIVTNIV